MGCYFCFDFFDYFLAIAFHFSPTEEEACLTAYLWRTLQSYKVLKNLSGMEIYRKGMLGL